MDNEKIVPQVLLLQLGSAREVESFADLYTDLHNKIKAKFSTMTMTTEAAAIDHLSTTTLQVALAVDAGIAMRANEELLYQLTCWVKAGGTLILACLFSRLVKPVYHTWLYEMFQLPWIPGDCFRTTFSLNPRMKATFGPKNYSTLKPLYSMRSQNLRNVSVEEQVYAPTISSRVESFIFPPDQVDIEECPAAFTKCGEGFVGYIGDVNGEQGSQSLLIAMICKLHSVRWRKC
jgi:hypothetical protein